MLEAVTGTAEVLGVARVRRRYCYTGPVHVYHQVRVRVADRQRRLRVGEATADSIREVLRERRDRQRLPGVIRRLISQGRRGRPRKYYDADRLLSIGLHRRCGLLRRMGRGFTAEAHLRNRYAALDPAYQQLWSEPEFLTASHRVEALRFRAVRLRLRYDESAVWEQEIANALCQEGARRGRET